MAHPSLEDQAADWLARMDRAEVSARERDAFEAWRSADPKHNAACLRLELGWERFDRLQALRPPQGEPDARLLEAMHIDEGEPAVPAKHAIRPRRNKQTWLWAASLAALAIGVAGYMATRSAATSDSHYATRIGEFRRIVLEDQSVVELDTATRLDVKLTSQTRRLVLLEGRARFTVTADPRRPFVVEAGQTRVRALGTAFTVRRNVHAVEVIVTEGSVDVGGKSALPRVVAAGETAAAMPEKVEVRKLVPSEVERSLAWQEGMLAFEGATLETVVAEFNRYNQTQLILADPALGSLRVGGYFRATGLDALTATLSRSFGIRAEQQADGIVLSAPQ